ncbi:DUF7706 family protein [Sulfurivermis fontis]|uniref:DUF7706 family protein n=1 Tax=Sulfurivermis fontis TaxID=1972068 RepID=UPI000FD8A2CD|nr:hypothetical protein [Sulfurivermis fontis]
MADTEPVVITVELTDQEAWDFAQFLKRVGHSDYLVNAENSEQAYRMLFAGEKVRAALADVGYAPR